MSILTAIMGLVKGVDSDDSENYLTVGLAGSLDKLDGHRHGDGDDGRPVTALANGAVGHGLLDIGGVVRASGSSFPTSGAGTIIYFDGGKGEVFAQNADAHVLLPLRLNNVVWIYPSGGIYIGATPTDPGVGIVQVEGQVKSPLVTSQRFQTYGGRPTAVASPSQAGTSPPVPVVAPSSTDAAGSISYGTGSGSIFAGEKVIVDFSAPYTATDPPAIILTGAGQFASGNYRLSVLGTPGNWFGFRAFNDAALNSDQPNWVYGFNYVVITT